MRRLFAMLVLLSLPVAVQAADLALVLRPRDEGGPITEVWRRDGLEWHRSAQRNDTLVAAGKDVWRITTRQVTSHYDDCRCMSALWDRLNREPTDAEVASCGRKATWDLPVATRVGDGKVRDLADVFNDVTGESEDGWSRPSFELLGVVGSKALMVSRLYSYSCGGAHGSESAQLFVTDLSTGSRTPLWSAAEEKSTAQALRPALIEKAVAAGMQTREEFDDLPIPDIGAPALRPRWTGLRFTPDWLLTWWGCFACSDGIWGSYSRSLWLPAGTAMPPSLAAYNLTPQLAGLTAAVPDAVAVSLVPRGLLPAEK